MPLLLSPSIVMSGNPSLFTSPEIEMSEEIVSACPSSVIVPPPANTVASNTMLSLPALAFASAIASRSVVKPSAAVMSESVLTIKVAILIPGQFLWRQMSYRRFIVLLIYVKVSQVVWES